MRKCGEAQGIDIRPAAQGGDIKVGDILMVRSGFVERYHELSPERRNALALRKHEVGSPDDINWAGVKQEEAILDWLHDCYFAGVAGDAPSFERWPPQQPYYLHEYILALWGMPLGEMWDLERLAAKCREMKRWTFFVTSAPATVLGTRSICLNPCHFVIHQVKHQYLQQYSLTVFRGSWLSCKRDRGYVN